MGVDCMIDIVFDEPPSQAMIDEWTWRMREAICAEDEEYPKFSISRDDPRVLELDQLWRWYSEGYERGPWPTIYAAVRWCIHHFHHDNARVFLYTDHSDRPTYPTTIADLEDTWKHWALFGHTPYYGRERADYLCCGQKIYVNSWSGSERGGYCPCCRKTYRTKNGVWADTPAAPTKDDL